EVCERLKSEVITEDIPVVFLSSHSSLQQRLQGYEVGADDYLTKPFEAEHLAARLRVLSSYHKDRLELRNQYSVAQNAAISAMTGTNELAQVMKFMERTISFSTIEATVRGVLDTMNTLGLDNIVRVRTDYGEYWDATDGVISPLERELIEMSDENQRFMDFGCRTLVHFSSLTILVRNMPLDDMERYGRMKDLIPFLLSAANTKVNGISYQQDLVEQGLALKHSFREIRQNLYQLVSSMVKGRNASLNLVDEVIHKLTMELLGMGLEEDQEAFLLERIDTAMQNIIAEMDVGPQVKDSFGEILMQLHSTTRMQEEILSKFVETQNTPIESIECDDNDDVELF
ncbi:MAG: response regulator, partial [Pseudomonadales bacterium]|nr:response regulator [Pseudomonadales bacterium]